MQWIIDNEPVEYLNAVKFMEERVFGIHTNSAPELVWCLEHPPLYTAGVSARPEDLLMDNFLPIYQTGRGGKYTYHGPGQRVVYIMLNLKKRNQCDIRIFIRNLGVVVINTLKRFAIDSYFDQEHIGVWVNHNNIAKKIAAFGVKIRKWVTFHGIAINVAPNLLHYQGIIPCGLGQNTVTSMQELGINISLTQFDKAFKDEFYSVFSEEIK